MLYFPKKKKIRKVLVVMRTDVWILGNIIKMKSKL